MRALLAAIIVHAVHGHGSMSFPRPRNAKKGAKFAADASCVGDACYWYQVGCFNGCAHIARPLSTSAVCLLPLRSQGGLTCLFSRARRLELHLYRQVPLRGAL